MLTHLFIQIDNKAFLIKHWKLEIMLCKMWQVAKYIKIEFNHITRIDTVKAAIFSTVFKSQWNQRKMNLFVD